MSDVGLGPIAEALSALIALAALIESSVAHRHSRKTRKDLDQQGDQMRLLQTQIQSLQIVQANKTNINVVVTTGSTGGQASEQIDSGPGPEEP